MKWNDNKRIFAFLVLNLFTILLFSHKRKVEAEWTIVTYMRASNTSSTYVEHSINSMQQAGSTDQVNILMQLVQPGNKKVLRYEVAKGSCIEVGALDQATGTNLQKELVACMRWAKDNYPAKHYMLILSSGDDSMGRFVDRNKMPIVRDECAIDTQDLEPIQDKKKGVKNSAPRMLERAVSEEPLFDNQVLTKSIIGIKKVLGKNLDILGIDTGLMATVEFVCQIKGAVDYLVASEDTKSLSGWDYAGFMAPLIDQPILFEPDILAQSIVVAYSDFYKASYSEAYDPNFTLSAIDVNKIGLLTEIMDAVTKQLAICKKNDHATLMGMIKYAREQMVEFHVANYIDLDSFYRVLQEKIREIIANQKIAEIKNEKEQIKAINDKIALRKLDELLSSVHKMIDKIVLSSLSGEARKNVQGLSIYYPKSSIYLSRKETIFSQKTSWSAFLRDNL